jgi:hypothetical protein
MKGGSSYGKGAVALAGVVVGAGTAANYKRRPQNVRDRCNEAIDVIVAAHKKADTNIYGIRPKFVEGLLDERKDIRVTLDGNEGDKTVIDQIIEKLKGYERTNTTPDQGEKTPPIILSRHFDTALMERANLLKTANSKDDEFSLDEANDLKGILKSMVGKESPFQIRLIVRNGLRTTESWTGTPRGTGLQDGKKLSEARGEAWTKTQHENTLNDLESVVGEYYTASFKAAFKHMANDDKIKALQNFSNFVKTAIMNGDNDLLEAIKGLEDGSKAMSIAMIMQHTDADDQMLYHQVKTVLES